MFEDLESNYKKRPKHRKNNPLKSELVFSVKVKSTNKNIQAMSNINYSHTNQSQITC